MSQAAGDGSARPSASTSDGDVANSGSQYALCALGVGLVALGMVMIVWSVVPGDGINGGNSSRPGVEAAARTSSVAFVLVGAGVTMLLLSLCLGIRNKQRRQDAQLQQRNGTYNTQLSQESEGMEERYTVPSYDEVVGGGPLPMPTSSTVRNNSASQLPSYEDVLEAEHVVVDAPNLSPTPDQAFASPAAPTFTQGGRWNGRAARKLLPLKIRRIKSEKLRVKSATNSPQPTAVFSIEPLTPPPQYDDKPPQL